MAQLYLIDCKMQAIELRLGVGKCQLITVRPHTLSGSEVTMYLLTKFCWRQVPTYCSASFSVRVFKTPYEYLLLHKTVHRIHFNSIQFSIQNMFIVQCTASIHNTISYHNQGWVLQQYLKIRHTRQALSRGNTVSVQMLSRAIARRRFTHTRATLPGIPVGAVPAIQCLAHYDTLIHPDAANYMISTWTKGARS